MIRALIFFLSALAAWGAALWFGIKPDFSRWSQPAVVALHAGPPLMLLSAWGLWRLIRWQAERRATRAAQSEEAKAQAQRQAAQEEARERHAEALRQRQAGCDCRGVAMMQVAQPEGAKPVFGLQGDQIDFSPFAGDAQDDAEPLAHLREGIHEALASLYRRSPGAAVLPIYVVPPAEAVGEDVFSSVREARQAVVAELQLRERQAAHFHRCLFLPGNDSVADSVIGLFDQAPDLPGAVVLAFDTAWLRALQTENDDAPDPQGAAQRQWIGPPSQGVFALLFTHPDLDTQLDAALHLAFEPEAMTPYWDRGLPGTGYEILLAALTPEERDSLRQAPVLARLHRAAFAQVPEGQRQALALVRQVQGLLEGAQVNAALIDSPFDPAEAKPEAAPPDCGWLVHNAGGVNCSGHRLAALGTALYNRGLSVDPIDMATNVVVQGGDYGQARSVALLALTVARAAEEQAATLGAEFSGTGGLGLFFAVPPGAAT